MTPYIMRVIVLILGLTVGCFLNVAILVFYGQSLARPQPSFCHSVRYSFVVLFSGFIAIYLFNRYGLGLEFLIQYYFFICLLAIALVDLGLMVIPMILVFPTIVLGLLSAWAYPAPELAGPWLEPSLGPRGASLAGSLIGLALGWGGLKAVGLTYKAARGREGLGDGDPPLLGLIGAFLGWRALPLVLLTASVAGLVIALVLVSRSGEDTPPGGWRQKPLPFGPFLVLGAFLMVFFGQAVIRWYWSLAG